MEFVAQHPLGVLHCLTALVALAAGFSTYFLGWRRVRHSGRSGSGGRHGPLAPARRQPRPVRESHVHVPYFLAALVANEDRWAEPESGAPARARMLA